MKIGISCCIAAMLAVLGCGGSASTPPSSAPGSADARSTTRLMSAPQTPQIVSSDEAVMRLTNARCDREVACNNVGSEGVFLDRDACARQLGHDAYASLQSQLCRGGIDDAKLATCLADVRNERCNNALDTIERVLSCRRRELCID
jgi:hypothetical protein